MGGFFKTTMIIFPLLLLSFVGACSYTVMTTKPEQPGDYVQLMEYETGGFQRRYRLHIPSGYNPEKPVPLVIALHGAFSSAGAMARRTGLNRIADREKFLVLYPNGIGLFGFLQHWNAGHCCAKAFRDDIDDVGFISAAVEDVCSRVNVDRGRVYLLGYSNGGMMAHRFAAEKSNDVAALAVVAGTIGSKPDDRSPLKTIPQPGSVAPVIIIHGMNDDYIPYEGGKATGRKRPESFSSVKDSCEFWIKNNGGLNHSEFISPDRTVRREMWSDGNGKPVVELYSLTGWGHDWPGPTSHKKGEPFPEFDAAETIWLFFKEHYKESR